LSEGDLPLAKREKIGAIIDYASGRNRYVGYLISLASHSFKNLRIGLDSANGASWMIAKAVFDALGAQTTVIGAEPNGFNINEGCGSTHPEALARLVREKHLDLGFAFDGDADRCIAVDENGNVVDGDAIMYILARRLKERGMLNFNTLVSTVMSNSGLAAALDKIGIRTVQTTVGDRFVYERMQQCDYSLGGEQSGHIIIRKYATTGDGILTAIMVCEELAERKTSLCALADPVKLFPQRMTSIRVKDKRAAMNDSGVKAAVTWAEREINGNGRVLLRESGTEPVVRIMIESESVELCDALSVRILEAVRAGGHACE
jgi:phosphoglucosamine mutase